MELLFKREQSAGVGGVSPSVPGLRIFGLGAPKFKLWAKIELEPEEQSVVDHYRFDQAILIDSFQPELLKKTAMVGAATFVVGLLVFWMLIKISAGVFLGLIAAAIAAYLYFDKRRETVFVRDLLHGRYFSCASVIELARKEAWLETISAFLRQVMESAKHWDGTEAIKIEALPKDVAKQTIIKGL